MQIADVNVLIYAHREESPDHDRYAAWLSGLATSGEPFAMSELALSGFVRIVTNPKVFGQPTPIAVAMKFADQLYARPNCFRVRPGPDHWSIFDSLCKAAGARGKLVADAYHAALAIEHDCELATTDGDFARFPGLRTTHPLRP